MALGSCTDAWQLLGGTYSASSSELVLWVDENNVAHTTWTADVGTQMRVLWPEDSVGLDVVDLVFLDSYVEGPHQRNHGLDTQNDQVCPDFMCVLSHV